MAKGLTSILLTAALGLNGSIAHATPEQTRAYNNMAHENIQCAAFYAVMARAMEHEKVPAAEQRFKELNELALRGRCLLDRRG